MMHYAMFTSPWQWLIVLAIVLLLFGPGRLGNLGRDLGKSIKEFKGAMNDKDITPDKIEGNSQASATVNQSEKNKA
ncbi:MAG: Sec-independent protein translocase subunit TatA/TatB [Thermodesulfobacteriota bacterium]